MVEGGIKRDKYVQFNEHVIAIKTYQADIIIKIMFVKLLNVGTKYITQMGMFGRNCVSQCVQSKS